MNKTDDELNIEYLSQLKELDLMLNHFGGQAALMTLDYYLKQPKSQRVDSLNREER